MWIWCSCEYLKHQDGVCGIDPKYKLNYTVRMFKAMKEHVTQFNCVAHEKLQSFQQMPQNEILCVTSLRIAECEGPLVQEVLLLFQYNNILNVA